jgi:iron complex transport system ATP-binding protein
MHAVLAHDLRVAYARGVWQLGPLSLAVPRGALVCLLGPNGSGKSTLLRVLARQLPAAGSVHVLDMPQQAYTPRAWAATLAYLPQTVVVDYDYSVEQTVSFGRFAHTRAMGFLTAADQAAISAALDATATAALRTRLLSTLSGGERQRVLLASVLVQQPQILLLDEPTTALDVHHQVALCTVLRQCVATGMTVMMASHDLSLAAQVSDCCLLLQQGRIVMAGPPEQVLCETPLRAVYGTDIDVVPHPLHGYPVVVPRMPARIAPAARADHA